MSKTINSSIQYDLFPETLDEKSLKDKIKKTKDEVNFQAFNILENTQKCPSCGNEYSTNFGCIECGYGVSFEGELIIGDEDISKEELDYLNDLVDKEEKKENIPKKMIELEKKLNGQDVIYTKQHNCLDEKNDKIYLQIGEKKYKIGIKYSIREVKSFIQGEYDIQKVAQNLKITYISIKNNRIYKKSYVKYFKELKNYILHEILNNPEINHSLV